MTTGGHPGDPAHDSAAGFLQRLHAEQNRDYNSARLFYADWWGVGYDGVDNDRGADLATTEIGSRAGEVSGPGRGRLVAHVYRRPRRPRRPRPPVDRPLTAR